MFLIAASRMKFAPVMCNAASCSRTVARSYLPTRFASRSIPWSKQTAQQKRSAYLMLTVPAVTFCLGTWQVYRLKWKLGIISQLESRMRATPLDLSSINLEEWAAIPEYTQVKLSGSFDHTREVLMENRQLVEEFESEIKRPDEQSESQRARVQRQQMQRRRRLVGDQLVVPFVLDSGDTVLVNRGWLPRDCPSELIDRPVGHIELTGAVRKNEKTSQFAQSNELDQTGLLRTRWFTRNVNQLASYLGTRVLFVDASRGDIDRERKTVMYAKSQLYGRRDGENQEESFGLLVPVGGQTRVQLRNEHLNYAITWYLVSILTSCLWFMRYVIP